MKAFPESRSTIFPVSEKLLQRRKLVQFVQQRKFHASLPVATLTGFPMPRRIRKSLMEVARDVTISDFCLHVFNYESNPKLQAAFARNKPDRTQLIEICDRYWLSMRESNRPGRAKSAEIAWIVPDGILDLESRVIRRPIEIEGLEYWDRKACSHYYDWLPWLSLEVVNLIRNWKLPKINAVRRTIFKFFKLFDVNGGAKYPWECETDSDLVTTPMEALYQFEPVATLEKALYDLKVRGKLWSINDLRCLHPEAVGYMKRTDRPLNKLFRDLADF